MASMWVSGEGGALRGRFSELALGTVNFTDFRTGSGEAGALRTGRSKDLSGRLSESAKGLTEGRSTRLSATVSVDGSQVGGRSSHGTAMVGE